MTLATGLVERHQKLKGPPQAAIAMMMRSALADRFDATAYLTTLFTSNCNCAC